MRLSIHTQLMQGLLLSLLLSLASVTQGNSQNPVNYINPADPSRGYWKLHTDHETRNTIIRLYNSGNELVYEEIMPGQYIKLTERTLNRISETLELVASNKLVLSKVKAYDLTAGYHAPEPVEAAVVEPTTKPTETCKEYASVRVDAQVLKLPNKLLVQCDNPTKRRLRIYLRDVNKQVVYADYMNMEKYARKIDMSGMRPGEYALVIASPSRKYPFRYTRQVTLGANAALEIR